LLEAGVERQYTSKGAMSVRIGNAQGAEIIADGKPVDLAPFQRANVAHLKVFAQGSLATRVDS
jgi:cytoskeleton protein RodZ